MDAPYAPEGIEIPPSLWPSDRFATDASRTLLYQMQSCVREAAAALRLFEATKQAWQRGLSGDVEAIEGSQVSSLRLVEMRLHGKSFVYAIAQFESLAKTLLRKDSAQALSGSRKLFEDARAVRDSLWHAEDRLRWLDRKGRTLNTRVLHFGNIFNDKLQATAGDGSLRSVQIARTNVDKLARCFRKTVKLLSARLVPA